MKRKVYEKELSRLEVELAKLQGWIQDQGLRVVVIFEGRDSAVGSTSEIRLSDVGWEGTGSPLRDPASLGRVDTFLWDDRYLETRHRAN